MFESIVGITLNVMVRKPTEDIYGELCQGNLPFYVLCRFPKTMQDEDFVPSLYFPSVDHSLTPAELECVSCLPKSEHIGRGVGRTARSNIIISTM
jgi:hypothetical protein